MTKPVSELWREEAEKWTDLESAASLLEESKSAILAQMMLKKGPMPVSRAEMLTKASEEWSEYVERTVDARTAANKAKIRMEYFRMMFFERNSREATERLEAKL